MRGFAKWVGGVCGLVGYVLVMLFIGLGAWAWAGDSDWSNELSDVSADFPGVVFSPWDFRDYSYDGFAGSETVSVPGSADDEGKYRVMLENQPRSGTLVVTRVSDGQVLTQVAWDEATAPVSNEVGVNWQLGALDFPAASAGLSHTVTYTANGSVLSAHRMNRWQRELVATQTAVGATGSENFLLAGGDTATGEIDFTGGIEVDTIQDLAGNTRLGLSASSPNVTVTGNFQSDNFRTRLGSANNIVIGQSAGNGASNTGTLNVIVGESAGDVLTTGERNTMLGYAAGILMTGGSYNVLVGDLAGRSLTTSGGVGFSASYNVFLGHQAGRGATTMEQGVFIGRDAGYSATTGIANVGVGESSGYNLTTGEDNVLVGSDAGSYFDNSAGITTGSHNTAVGNNAGSATSGGAVGVGTPVNVTGSYNAAVGAFTDWGSATASYRTAIGPYAQNDADNQVVLGRQAGSDQVWVPGDLYIGTGKDVRLYRSAADTLRTPDSLTVDATATIATADINGGNIDGTTIGAATLAAGTFNGLALTKSSNETVTIDANNTNTGTASRVGFKALTDDGGGYLLACASTYTGVSDWAETVLLSADSTLAGGLALYSFNKIRFQNTAGTDALTVTGGNTELAGGLKVGRATGSSGSIASTVSIFGVSGSGARSITLPSAATVKAGRLLIIQDEAGNAGSGTITINRAGSDTINGATSVTITTNYGRRFLYSNGGTGWFY